MFNFNSFFIASFKQEMSKSFSQRNPMWTKKNSLEKQKHGYLIHVWSDKAFKGTVVNRTLPSLYGGSLEITLTAPLGANLSNI